MTNLSPRWRTGDAAHAADVSHRYLLNLIDRGAFRLAPDDKDTEGAGDGRAFTRETIFRLAMTATLSRAGLHTRLAASLADQFSASPPAETHLPFLIADLADGGRLLVDEPSEPSINLVVDVARIVAAVEARLSKRTPL